MKRIYTRKILNLGSTRNTTYRVLSKYLFNRQIIVPNLGKLKIGFEL